MAVRFRRGGDVDRGHAVPAPGQPRGHRRWGVVRGDGPVPGLDLGVDPGRTRPGVAEPADPVGRPDVAGRVARIPGVRPAGPLQVDSGSLVARLRRSSMEVRTPGRSSWT